LIDTERLGDPPSVVRTRNPLVVLPAADFVAGDRVPAGQLVQLLCELLLTLRIGIPDSPYEIPDRLVRSNFDEQLFFSL
jgi:hypothetical protein